MSIKKDASKHTCTCKHILKKPNALTITDPHKCTYTHTLSLTHKQERTSYYLEISPDIACHSQRPWSGFAYRTSYSAHTQTHTRSWKGGKKSLEPCWRKRGNPATSAVSVVDSIAASLESDHRAGDAAVWALPLGQPPPSSDPYFQTS